VQSKGHSLSTQVRHELDLAGQRGHVLRYIYIDAALLAATTGGLRVHA
jgi:hypothetical protein